MGSRPPGPPNDDRSRPRTRTTHSKIPIIIAYHCCPLNSNSGRKLQPFLALGGRSWLFDLAYLRTFYFYHLFKITSHHQSHSSLFLHFPLQYGDGHPSSLCITVHPSPSIPLTSRNVSLSTYDHCIVVRSNQTTPTHFLDLLSSVSLECLNSNGVRDRRVDISPPQL